jgi:hypothetical protein
MEREKTHAKRVSTIVAVAAALTLVMGLLTGLPAPARAAGPCAELAYANDHEFCIFIAKIITDPTAHLRATAEPIYIAAYFPLPVSCDTHVPSTCHPETLPSGYMPQCNPCFHGGALNNFPYHDHVMAGAPGFGDNGTAGGMKGPWLLYVVAYDPTYSNQPSFAPLESAQEIATGEHSGDFLSINPNASNPYEIDTGVVLIFGVQPLGS